MLNPTKNAFETAGQVMKTGIDAELQKAKAPGGILAKETYVTFGDRIKQVRGPLLSIF